MCDDGDDDDYDNHLEVLGSGLKTEKAATPARTVHDPDFPFTIKVNYESNASWFWFLAKVAAFGDNTNFFFSSNFKHESGWNEDDCVSLPPSGLCVSVGAARDSRPVVTSLRAATLS